MNKDEIDSLQADLIEFSIEEQLELKINTDFHYSILTPDSKVRIDIYPVNKRFHIVKPENLRGSYRTYNNEVHFLKTKLKKYVPDL